MDDTLLRFLPILISALVGVAGLGAAWGVLRANTTHHKESISSIRAEIYPLVEASRETVTVAKSALNTALRAHTRLDVHAAQLHFLDNERTRHWERIVTMPLRISQRIPSMEAAPQQDDSHQMPQPVRSTEEGT